MVYTSSMAAVSGAKGGSLPAGYEWTETDWASDEVEEQLWKHPRNSYARSKVDTEHFIHDQADASGKWDAITMNPAMICGPVLFKAQVGQWIEKIGRMAAGEEPNWPSKYFSGSLIDFVAKHACTKSTLRLYFMRFNNSGA